MCEVLMSKYVSDELCGTFAPALTNELFHFHFFFVVVAIPLLHPPANEPHKLRIKTRPEAGSQIHQTDAVSDTRLLTSLHITDCIRTAKLLSLWFAARRCDRENFSSSNVKARLNRKRINSKKKKKKKSLNCGLPHH